jgi:TadE-like protein
MRKSDVPDQYYFPLHSRLPQWRRPSFRSNGIGAQRERERGATAVETAILLPLLLLILFAVLDFGMYFSQWLSVRNGEREGLRMAIVNVSPVAPNPAGWNCPIESPVAPAAGSPEQSLVCFTKSHVGLDQKKTRVKILFAPPYRGGQPVKVCVQYEATSLAGLAPKVMSKHVLTAQSESLIEMDQLAMTAPFEETPLIPWSPTCDTL